MFIELTNKIFDRSQKKYISGTRFLLDFNSGWEIYDNKSEPAGWVNNSLGMNKNVSETYEEIKSKLIKAGLLIGE